MSLTPDEPNRQIYESVLIGALASRGINKFSEKEEGEGLPDTFFDLKLHKPQIAKQLGAILEAKGLSIMYFNENIFEQSLSLYERYLKYIVYIVEAKNSLRRKDPSGYCYLMLRSLDYNINTYSKKFLIEHYALNFIWMTLGLHRILESESQLSEQGFEKFLFCVKLYVFYIRSELAVVESILAVKFSIALLGQLIELLPKGKSKSEFEQILKKFRESTRKKVKVSEKKGSILDTEEKSNESKIILDMHRTLFNSG